MTEDKILRSSAKRITLLVLTCFFLSGVTGLIYEILWTRMIVKIIGGAPFAVSIILTVFMGGLGLGSYLASRTIDRIKEPMRLVRIYGILELAIGAYGLAVPVLLVVFRPVYAIIYNRLFSHFMLYSFLTFVGCSLLWPEARERLADTAFATTESLGNGQVILFANDPTFRRWLAAEERLFLNAVLLGPGMGSSPPMPW